MITLGLMSSNKSDWETPQWLYDELNEEFYFNVDVCADKKNAKHSNYFNKDQNGLMRDWYKYKTCFMNPPYGRKIGEWVAKA